MLKQRSHVYFEISGYSRYQASTVYTLRKDFAFLVHSLFRSKGNILIDWTPLYRFTLIDVQEYEIS